MAFTAVTIRANKKQYIQDFEAKVIADDGTGVVVAADDNLISPAVGDTITLTAGLTSLVDGKYVVSDIEVNEDLSGIKKVYEMVIKFDGTFTPA